MNSELRCYRCGASLKELSLPLSRFDECPACSVALHVCRQCEHFDTRVPRQCKEDGAEDVTEKSRVNFCDWFKPGFDVFDGREKAAEDRARAELETLFGDASSGPDEKPGSPDADDLFK